MNAVADQTTGQWTGAGNAQVTPTESGLRRVYVNAQGRVVTGLLPSWYPRHPGSP